LLLWSWAAYIEAVPGGKPPENAAHIFLSADYMRGDEALFKVFHQETAGKGKGLRMLIILIVCLFLAGALLFYTAGKTPVGKPLLIAMRAGALCLVALGVVLLVLLLTGKTFFPDVQGAV